MATEEQSNFEGLPPPHHQEPVAQPLCLMGDVVLMSLKVDQLQVAAASVGAYESRKKNLRNKNKSNIAMIREGNNHLQTLCNILSQDHSIPPLSVLYSQASG